jgi:hypothetical protein
METGFIALAVLALFIGVGIGYLLGRKVAERRYLRDTKYTQGTLNVDCSDPEFEPGLFLGLAVPVRDVIPRKYITLDINLMSQNSQK